jgi:hypothetical protein
VEGLEDRALPSGVNPLPADGPAPHGGSAWDDPYGHAGILVGPAEAPSAPHAQTFKESLTITHFADGVYTYEGEATHLGHVTAFSFPDGKFTKVAADGDQIFGQINAATATTGTLTFNGGTGEFATATGSASYVISTDARTGLQHVAVVGTLSSSADGDEGDGDDTTTHAFAITGGGTAPEGLPLAPFVLGPHPTSGTASYLGHYTGLGMFEHDPLVINPTTGAVTTNFQGDCMFVAADGDKLVTHYGLGYSGKLTGQLTADGTTVVGVQFDAIFTIDGAASTGRFQGAGGSWRMIAHAASIPLAGTIPGHSAPFPYTWTGGGTITFAGEGHDHGDSDLVPFSVNGGGVGAKGIPLQLHQPAPHNATGTATLLGHYSAEGMFQLDSFTSATSGTFSSAQPVVFTADDGDRLAFNYAGTFQVHDAGGGKVYAVFVATFTPVPQDSTGRFKEVTGGSFVMTATTDPFVLGSTTPLPYTWVGSGALEVSEGHGHHHYCVQRE